MFVVLFAGSAVVAVVQVTSKYKSILDHSILYPVYPIHLDGPYFLVRFAVLHHLLKPPVITRTPVMQ